MIDLKSVVARYPGPQFEALFRQQIASLGVSQLPLQQGLSKSSVALDGTLDVLILRTTEKPAFIEVKCGIFYSGIIAGCSCADDPTPLDEQNEYCELLFVIDKGSGEAEVILLT